MWSKHYPLPIGYFLPTITATDTIWVKTLSASQLHQGQVNYFIFLVSRHGLACQQEISLVLAKILPIHLLDDTKNVYGLLVQQLRRVVAHLACMNTTYCVTHLYANEIYVPDERHAMILVSWIEIFIFIRGVIIEMMPVKWCDNIFDT